MSYDFDTLNAHANEQTPNPGSARDMVSRANDQETPAPFPVDNPSVDLIVPVRPDVAEECVTQTMLLSSTNPFLLMLPRDMRRSRAVVIPVTNAVYLTTNKDIASQISTYITAGNTAVTSLGAYIPQNVGVPLDHRDQMFAVISTTVGTSPISVIVERYAA
jgi:hypothetical protein